MPTPVPMPMPMPPLGGGLEMLLLVTLEPTEARCMVRNELAEEGTSVDVILYKIGMSMALASLLSTNHGMML